MLSNNFYNQDIAAIARRTYFPEHNSTAYIDAKNLFECIQRKVNAEKVWDWIRGRRSDCLMDLDEVKSQIKVTNSHSCGLREVPLSQIRGSQGRMCDYDARFQPLDGRTKERWISVAAAGYRGQGLPPVELVKIGDFYFVRDGNHRVSVARAMGKHEIDAEVIEWQVAGPLPWEQAPYAMANELPAAA